MATQESERPSEPQEGPEVNLSDQSGALFTARLGDGHPSIIGIYMPLYIPIVSHCKLVGGFNPSETY